MAHCRLMQKLDAKSRVQECEQIPFCLVTISPARWGWVKGPTFRALQRLWKRIEGAVLAA